MAQAPHKQANIRRAVIALGVLLVLGAADERKWVSKGGDQPRHVVPLHEFEGPGWSTEEPFQQVHALSPSGAVEMAPLRIRGAALSGTTAESVIVAPCGLARQSRRR